MIFPLKLYSTSRNESKIISEMLLQINLSSISTLLSHKAKMVSHNYKQKKKKKSRIKNEQNIKYIKFTQRERESELYRKQT